MYRKKKKLLALAALLLLAVLIYSVAAKTGGNTAVSASKVKYNNYCYKDVSLEVSLPESTDVTEDYYSGGELLLNSYLSDEKHNYHGYIQIWNVDDPEEFIDRSKLNSSFNFTSFENEKISSGSFSGFAVTWTARLQDGGDMAGKDYLLQKKGKEDQFLRVSLTVDADVFPEKLAGIGEAIISSLKWK